jgi:hypothetical protein
LADLRDEEFIDCNTEANARLIAAAPEMLEALEMFLKWDESGIPNIEDCIQRARTALAKAKSDSD